MAFDLQGIPNTSQANDLLGLYLNSQHVQEATFVLKHGLIEPFLEAEQMATLFEKDMFCQGTAIISAIVEKLKLGANNNTKLQELLQNTLKFSATARASVKQLLKLKIFKTSEDFMLGCEEEYADTQKEIFKDNLRRKRADEIKFRNRVWRGH